MSSNVFDFFTQFNHPSTAEGLSAMMQLPKSGQGQINLILVSACYLGTRYMETDLSARRSEIGGWILCEW